MLAFGQIFCMCGELKSTADAACPACWAALMAVSHIPPAWARDEESWCNHCGGPKERRQRHCTECHARLQNEIKEAQSRARR